MKKLAPPSPVELRFRRILALLGFLMVVFGQFWVFAEPATLDALPPSTLILSGIGLAFFFASFFIRLRPSFQSRIENFRISHKVIWVLAAVFFSCLAAFAMLLFMKYDKNTYIPVLTAWFGAGAFYVFAFRGAIPSWKGIWSWVKAHRSELVIVGGITLVAAGLRLITLGVYPRVIDGDEGLLGLYAQTTNVGALANPFALWENFGALYLQGVNLAIRLFGATPLALRIFPAISGILAVPALYLFARRVAGKKVATLSAFLLAISHTHINFSRIGSVGYIHGTWLVPLELFLLLTGLEKKKTWMTAAAGVLLAIHFCVYLTSQVIIALVLVFMLLLLIFKKRWFLQCYRQAAAFWGGFVIMILPEFAYVLKNPVAFFDRLSRDGTFQSGWLFETMANTGKSAFEVIVGRISHAFLSLIYYPALDFYGSNIPMLTLFVSVFFLIGAVIALIKIRKTGMLLLNGYFWSLTVAIGVFAIPPSADSYRMLAALPAAMLFAGLGINELMETIGAGWARARAAYTFVVTGLLLTLTIFNIWVYYGDFVGQCRYGGDIKSRFASYLGSYAKTVDPGSNIHLLSDADYQYGTHPSTDFLSGSREITNIPEPVAAMGSVLGDTVVASPNRIGELKEWIKLRPGGHVDFVYDCSNLILLAYQLP